MIVDSSTVSPLLPTFENLSSYFNRFKPRFVYEQRHPTLYFPDIDLPPEIVPQLEFENSSRFGPLEPTRQSTRVYRTPNWYEFSLLYPTYLFHLVAHKLPNMNVDRNQWRKNFCLLKKMTRETLLHVFQMSSLLDVNGFIQSKFILMELLIGRKLN